MEYRRFIKKLDVPSGFTVPTMLTYDDIVARAISRADLHEFVTVRSRRSSRGR